MSTSLATRRRTFVDRTNSRRRSLFTAGSLALFACGDDTSGPKPDVTWEGTVTSAATGAPIAGADVGVGTPNQFTLDVIRSGTTDAQGHYSLTIQGCVKEPYLTAAAIGYFPNDKAIACHAGTIAVDIALTPSP